MSYVKAALAGAGGMLGIYVLGKVWYYVKVLFVVEQILKKQGVTF